MYFELKNEPNDSYLVHENILLVSANNEDEALEVAEDEAGYSVDENEDDHLTLNDKPVVCRFAGVRKIWEILDQKDGFPLSDRIELTYSEYEVDKKEEVVQLANGDFVDVLYRY